MKNLNPIPNGTLVVVTDNKHGHDFKIGETVKIVDYYKTDSNYRCENEDDFWFLMDDEFELASENVENKQH